MSLRWKRFKQTIPILKRLTTDRAPTRKESRKVLAHSDSRLKAAALMMASGGLRVGAFWYPKVGGGYGFMRVRDVSFRENGIAAVRTYSGEPEEATALVSAEAVAALKRYWRTRKREGERMGPYSPVLAVDKKRVVPDSFRKDRRRYPEHPSGLKAALTVDGIQSAFAKAWKASGVLPEGRSPEFRSCHGLRKRWETEAKRSVGTKIGTWRGADDRIAAEDIEALLGHRSSYHRPSLERLEAVYLSLQPFLTISPGRGRPPIQNHDLGDSNSAILTLKREFRRQGQELAALDQKIDGLVSMVERLVITTRPSYGAVESDMPA